MLNFTPSMSQLFFTPPSVAHLEFLRLSANFKQLCDGVHEALEVMVTHLFDLSVMVANPSLQLLHEEPMLLAIVHRSVWRRSLKGSVFEVLYS